MNDELRDRLRSVDPMPPDVPVEPVTAPAARERLERIMNQPLTDHRPDHVEVSDRRPVRSRWRSPILVGVAAAAVVAVAAAAIVTRAGDDPAEEEIAAPLELSLGESNALASCMAFDVAVLADMTPAFAATAVAIDGEVVTLDVDTWYAGGDAAQVVLRAPAGMQALIDGFDIEIGRQYLITAAGGTVNYCGYSGPATPELTAAFEQAFNG